MSPQAGETLADLINARAGRARGDGSRVTFDQLAERSVDPDTGYQPSYNLLWKVARDQPVKINPPLIAAIAAGLGLPLDRVQRAAARQYLGWDAIDPGIETAGEDDEVIRTATRGGATPASTRGVEEHVRRSRRDDA